MAVRTFITTIEQAQSWGRLGKKTPGLTFEIATRSMDRWRPLSSTELARVKTSMFFRVCRFDQGGEMAEVLAAAPENREWGAEYFRTEGPFELRNLEWWMCAKCERAIFIEKQGMNDLCRPCTDKRFHAL